MTLDGSATVIAAYDGSPDAKRALAWSAHLAKSTRAPLRVVVSLGDMNVRRVTELDAEWERVHRQELSADARAAVDALGLEGVDLKLSPHSPAPAVLDEADESSVVVLGSRGHGRLSEAFMGSVSQHIAHLAPCTVVVVRETSDPDAQAVVVGVDGSPGCEPALDFAFRYAAQEKAPVRAVYVSQSTPARLTHAQERPMTPEDKELATAQPVIDELLHPYRQKHPDVAVETQLLTGSVVRALADASEHAALVVVGSRGRGAFSSMLLGSVGHGLLHHAQCPVAIAR